MCRYLTLPRNGRRGLWRKVQASQCIVGRRPSTDCHGPATSDTARRAAPKQKASVALPGHRLRDVWFAQYRPAMTELAGTSLVQWRDTADGVLYTALAKL